MFIRRDGSNWELVAIHGDGSELCIATFDTKEDAETARTALDKAAGTDETWDVREFKQIWQQPLKRAPFMQLIHHENRVVQVL